MAVHYREGEVRDIQVELHSIWRAQKFVSIRDMRINEVKSAMTIDQIKDRFLEV